MGWFDELAAIISKKMKERDVLAAQLNKAAKDKKKMKDVDGIVKKQIALDAELKQLVAKIDKARELDAAAMKKVIDSFVL
jgi:Tfp pilus assembly protein PilO